MFKSKVIRTLRQWPQAQLIAFSRGLMEYREPVVETKRGNTMEPAHLELHSEKGQEEYA